MESGVAARNGGRLGIAALAAILLLGLGLRVGEAWDGRAPVYDAAAYAAIAANLERGEGFTVGAAATQPSSNYSPGLPLLVAGVYALSGGEHERLARLALALIGTLAVWFTYLLGRRLARATLGGREAGWSAGAGGGSEGGASAGGGTSGGSDARSERSSAAPPAARPPRLGEVGERLAVVAGLVGALIVAVYPALVEYQGMLMSEPLAATLLAGAVLSIFWAWDGRASEGGGADGRTSGPRGGANGDGAGGPGGGGGRDLARWLIPGAVLGALSLVRPEYLGVSVLLALLVASAPAWQRLVPLSGTNLCHAGWARGLAAGAVLLAGVALVVVPWTVRNVVALDRAVPISTGGGQVLFAGTYLPSDGDPERVGAGVVAENPDLFGPDAVERLRLEQILARLAAREYPALEADQALSRMGREQLWDDLSEAPLEYAGFVAEKLWRVWGHGPRAVMREPGWELFHWALVGFGLLGLGLLAARGRPETLVLATILLAITAVGGLLVASPRRFLVLLPLVAALAGVGAAWAWARAAERRSMS